MVTIAAVLLFGTLCNRIYSLCVDFSATQCSHSNDAMCHGATAGLPAIIAKTVTVLACACQGLWIINIAYSGINMAMASLYSRLMMIASQSLHP